MTSINQYSVSLSLEAGGLFTNATLARGHLQKLNRVVRELQTPVEVIEDKINFFTSALGKLGKMTEQQREIENRLYQELDKKMGGDARRLELMRQEEEQFKKMLAQEQHAAEITERHRSAVVKSNEAKEQAVRAAQEHARAGRIGVDVLQQEIAYQYKLHDAVRKRHDPAFIAEQKKQTDALEQHMKAEREALSLEEKHLSITERFAAAKANLDRIRAESLGALKEVTYTKELLHLEETRDKALLAADPVHQQALKDQAAEKQRQIGMEKEIIALTEKHRSADEVYAATKHRLDELLAHDASFAITYTKELMDAERKRDERLKAEDPAHQKRLQDELEAKERQKKAEIDLGRLRESLFSAEDRHRQRIAQYDSLRSTRVAGGLNEKEYRDLVAKSEATMRAEMVDKNAIATQERLNGVINRHRTELQKLRADLELLLTAQSAVVGSDERLANAISNVNEKIREEEDRLHRLNNTTNQTSGIVSGLTNRFAAFMAARFTVSTISNLVSQADQANIELSRTEAILGAISGSKFAGNQLIADLRQLTRQMPITLKDAAEGSKNLIAYGMSSREVIPVIRAIGAITGGNTERFKNLANAIAQMRGANRLMGQEVIQAVNAGWNPLAEISRNTGKSILVLKKEMEEGKLGFDLVTQALQTATTGMGRFANVAGDVMNTVAGKQQMLTARWEEGMARMGKAIEPLSIAWKEFSTEAIEGIVPNLEKLLNTFGRVQQVLLRASLKDAGTTFFGDDSLIDRIGKVADFYDMAIYLMGQKEKAEPKGGGRFGFSITGSAEEMSKNVILMKKVGNLQQDFLNRGLLQNEHIQAYNMYLRRQTEEKEKQKRIADAQEKKDKQQKELSLEQMKAKEMADQKFETMMNRIKIQTEELTRGKVAADALRAEFAGLSEEQKKQYVLASRQFEIAKQKNDIEEKAAKDQIRYRDLIAKYQKKSESSAETAAREIRDIDKALAMKQISLMEANDIKQKIIAGVVRAEGGDKMPIGAGPPKAMLKGSAEAVNAVLSKMREPVAIQAKQLEEMKLQRAAIRDVEKAVKNQNTVEAKR